MRLYGEAKTECSMRIYERELRRILKLAVRKGDITGVEWSSGRLVVTFVQVKGVSVTL